MKTKLVAFDVFGTLLDMSNVPREELEAYGRHIAQPEWAPLRLPDHWQVLPTFPDVWPGLITLAMVVPTVVTLSNAPLRFQRALWAFNDREGANIDEVVPLEVARVFKPHQDAYRAVLRMFPEYAPEECLMVTANEHFGDLEGARSVGMRSMLIRGKTGRNMHSVAAAIEDGIV